MADLTTCEGYCEISFSVVCVCTVINIGHLELASCDSVQFSYDVLEIFGGMVHVAATNWRVGGIVCLLT
jgi:hypothetical protein